MTTDIPSLNIDCIETETGAHPTHSVIWLHGLGANGHDFEPLVPALQIPPQTPMRFIFPHAPVRPITINGHTRMRGWYDITAADFEHDQDRKGIEHSATIICALIERENNRATPIPPENIFLAGFSQGGAVALHTGLRYNHPLAGIIALSAYLPLANSLEQEKSAANQPTPIFIAHGTHDPVIPLPLAHRSQQQLTQSGYSITRREYPIQHNVSPEEINDIANFLREHLHGAH